MNNTKHARIWPWWWRFMPTRVKRWFWERRIKRIWESPGLIAPEDLSHTISFNDDWED